MWGSVITSIAVVDIQRVGIDCINNDGARVWRVNGGERGEIPGHIDKGKKGHTCNERPLHQPWRWGCSTAVCEAVDGDETGGGEWAAAGPTSAAAAVKHQPCQQQWWP